MSSHRIPTLLLAPPVWQKLLTYVQLCPVEINGWAYVRKVSPSLLYVGSSDDVFITEQVVTAGSADVSADTVGMALYNATVAGRSEELRLQWHSHVKGNAVFSGTDTGTMDGYADGGAEWMVSLVLNKYGQVTGRLDMYHPMSASVDLAVYLEQSRPPDLAEQCADDIRKAVTERTFASQAAKKGSTATNKVTERLLRDCDLTFGDLTSTHILLSKPK